MTGGSSAFWYLPILIVGTLAGRVINWVIIRFSEEGAPEKSRLRNALTELVNGILWVLCAACFGRENPVYACTLALACSVLICVFWIDFDHMLIYNRFVLLLMVLGSIAMLTDRFANPLEHLIGLCSGGGVFLLLYYGAIAVLKREGIGFGDVKLAAAVGFLLGWRRFLFAMLIGSVLGSVVLVTVNRLRGDPDREYPFGPFIVIGTLCGVFLGEPVITWYLKMLLG